jgi:peptidoglycan hydrolase-like protein with peptidoglycan-binding domain
LLLTAAAIATPSMAGGLLPRPAAPAGMTVAAAYNETVREIQAQLNARGFDAGPADGLMGARTRGAIEAYQRQNGLLATGQPSQSLLQHMQVAAQPAPRAAAPAPAATGPRDVERLQRGLGRLGYEVSISGRVDAQTRAAVRAYQRDRQLLVTGDVNEALIEHVRGTLREARQDRGSDGSDADGQMVADIQAGLRARGYTVGNVAGELDRSTREAIRTYQRDRGDPQTGEPSTQLAEQLAEGLPASLGTRENIRKVQHELNRRGYTAGPADGVMGPATRTAIQDYRRRNGLEGSSEISASLLSSLGIAEAAAGDTGEPDRTAPTGRWKTALYDTFKDGDYTGNPHWQVLAKSFSINDGTLQSSVVEPTHSSDQRGEAVLKGLLGQVLGVPQQQQSNAAAIAQAVRFSEEFQLQVRVRQIDADGRGQMHFGTYRGTNAVHGYRVMYDGAAGQPLAILVVDSAGATVVASTSQPTSMTDGNWHTIDFTRDANGRLSLIVDGNAVLTADHGGGDDGGFSGFSFVNVAGTWGLDDIRIEARPDASAANVTQQTNRVETVSGTRPIPSEHETASSVVTGAPPAWSRRP